MSENEEWYDKEIAPALREIGKKCEEKGVAFVSVVEYDPGEIGRSFTLPATAALAMVMINYCARTAPNLDSYVIGLLRYCRQAGINVDSSIIAKQWMTTPKVLEES